MTSAAPAHALLSAAHSLLRPAMHHGRDPPPPPPAATDLLIDEVTLPDLADLGDVVDAINKLCDSMKSSYDETELTDILNDELTNEELRDTCLEDVNIFSVDCQVFSEAVRSESNLATERVDFPLDTPVVSLAPTETLYDIVDPEMYEMQEWSDNIFHNAGWSESVVKNIHVVEDMDSIFKKVGTSKECKANFLQDDVLVKETSVNLEPAKELINSFQKATSAKQPNSQPLDNIMPAENWNISHELRPDQPLSGNVQNVPSASSNEEWSSDDVHNTAPADGNVQTVFTEEYVASQDVLPRHREDISKVQKPASTDENFQTVLTEKWIESLDALPRRIGDATADVESTGDGNIQTTLAERWIGSQDVLPGQAEEVTSDGERGTWDGGGSELYYTASSEVSLTSEAEPAGAEARVVVAGHVAAMRERFENMTRAPTPCEHTSRDRSPSPSPAL